MNRLILLLLLMTPCFADVTSTGNQIKFDLQMDHQAEMILNETGLGINTISPLSSLDINGTLGLSASVVSSDANLENLNSIILVGSSANNVILTLPNASSVTGRFYTIKHNNNTVRSTLTSSSNIDGEPYLALNPIANNRLHPCVTVMSDGTTWNVISAHRQNLSDLVASDNLVVWWSFDDEPTTTYLDHSLNGNNGTIGGAADYIQINGKVGRAIQGITRQTMLSVTHNSTLAFTAVSAGFWIKGSNVDEASWGNYSSILSKMNTNIHGWQFDFNQNTVSPRRIRTRTDVSTSDVNNVTTEVDVFDDAWHHVVYTMADDTASFYVDGTLSSTRNLLTGSGNTISNTSTLYLFSEVNMGMDEIRIYNRELSATEVYQWFIE